MPARLGAFHSPKIFGLNFRKFWSQMKQAYTQSSRGQFLPQASGRHLSYVFKQSGWKLLNGTREFSKIQKFPLSGTLKRLS